LRATRVVQAIRSRRYVNQKEIAEALGIDQRRVSEALTRAIAFDMIGDEEWKKCREAAKGYVRGLGSCSTRRTTRTSNKRHGSGGRDVSLSLHSDFTGIPFSLVGPVNR
jgi:hypothetical protein